jgi:hypothetical protein
LRQPVCFPGGDDVADASDGLPDADDRVADHSRDVGDLMRGITDLIGDVADPSNAVGDVIEPVADASRGVVHAARGVPDLTGGVVDACLNGAGCNSHVKCPVERRGILFVKNRARAFAPAVLVFLPPVRGMDGQGQSDSRSGAAGERARSTASGAYPTPPTPDRR